MRSSIVKRRREDSDEAYEPSSESESDMEEPPKKRSRRMEIESIFLSSEEDLDYNPLLEGMEISGLEEEVDKIQKLLEDEEPTIAKILKLPLTDDEKKEMTLLYEIYANSDEYSTEHYHMRKKLISLIQHYGSSNFEERLKVEAEIKRLTKIKNISDVYEIKQKIISLNANDETKSRLLSLVSDMEMMEPNSEFYNRLREKVNLAINLPYKNKSNIGERGEDITSECVRVRKILDEELYGMNSVKDEIITFLISRRSNPSSKISLALKGPPGVGKTAICKTLAKAIGLPFERIALGGMTDSAALKGSSSVWVGGEASIILLFMKHARISDGILMFDEIDKLGEDGRSKVVQHALLHITDYTQNSKFRDLFLSEISHDLSSLWFLFAMNDDTRIDPVLRDRLHIIDVKPYDRKELEIIMEKYLLPRAIKDVGMNEHDHACIITADGKAAIFNEMDTDIRESGVRAIDGLIRELVCRINALRLTTVGPDSPLTYAKGASALTFPLMITQELIRVLIPKREKKSISYIS